MYDKVKWFILFDANAKCMVW